MISLTGDRSLNHKEDASLHKQLSRVRKLSLKGFDVIMKLSIPSQLFLFLMAISFVLTMSWYTITSDHFVNKSARHPLSFSYLDEIHQNEKSVRYLTFGSSSTWGLGLDDVHKSAYPWLLSPEVHNVASRIGGPAVSALCTESIIGDRMYDVIVIEFFQDAEEGLLQLARRIRQRFPAAAIVFTQLWSLDHVVLYHHHRPDHPEEGNNTSTATEVKTFTSWKREELNTKGFFGDENVQRMLLDTSMSDNDHYYWSFANFSRQEAILKQAVEEVQGLIYKLPYPENNDATVALLSPQYMQYFQDENPSLLSEKGHEVVAKGILDILRRTNNAQIFDLDRPNRNQVGSWEERDYCSNWYATGILASLINSHRSTNLVKMLRPTDSTPADKEFDTGSKYALEITSRSGGFIEVNNPFDEQKMLYVTYMTAGKTMQGGKIYPKTKVIIHDRATVILDPFHEDENDDDDMIFHNETHVNNINNLRQASSSSYYYNYNRHLTRTTAVGTIKGGGKTLLNLQPLEPSRNNFRLVGISILEDAIVDSVPFEFALEPETVIERRIKQLGIKW